MPLNYIAALIVEPPWVRGSLIIIELGNTQYHQNYSYIKDALFIGNDLARVLRWGPGYTGAEDLMSLLHDIIDAEDIRLDR